MADKTPAEIAAKLKPADRKGILTRPGSANFSSAVLQRLFKAGLLRMDYYPTDLGWEVRKALGAKD